MVFSEDQRTAVEAEPTKMCEKLNCLAELLKSILSKLSNVELRQSKSSGEINDALRAFHQWACGQSSGVPKAAVEAVAQIILEGPSTYYKNFADKDDRRCEFELWKFWRGRAQRLDPSHEPVGYCRVELHYRSDHQGRVQGPQDVLRGLR